MINHPNNNITEIPFTSRIHLNTLKLATYDRERNIS